MSTTAKDVAKRLGLSQSSVSRILSNTGRYRYSPETRQRVLSVAAEMDYRPNAVARSLRTQRTNIIGLYHGYGHIDARNPYLAEIMEGMLNECDKLKYALLLHGGGGVSTAEEIYRELANGKMDGVILTTPPSDRLVELLASSSLPALVIVDPVRGFPSVVGDDAAGAGLIAKHLAEKGHRHIMYCVAGGIRSISAQRRLATFLDVAAGYGMTVTETIEEEDGWGLSGEQKQLLAAPRGVRPTVAVCWHDDTAYGLVNSCRSLGLRVPEDLAIVGFNGIPTAVTRFCNITTIRVPWREMGGTAVSSLVAMMRGESVAAETTFPVELVVGETT